MKKYLPLSIVVGLISMVWVFVCNHLGWPSWVGFLGWSIYFYGGAEGRVIMESGPGYILGMVLAFITVWVQGFLPDTNVILVIPIFFLAFLMTYAQTSRWFQVAPATFLGCVTFFATGSLWLSFFLGFIMGMCVLGLITTAVVSALPSND